MLSSNVRSLPIRTGRRGRPPVDGRMMFAEDARDQHAAAAAATENILDDLDIISN